MKITQDAFFYKFFRNLKFSEGFQAMLNETEKQLTGNMKNYNDQLSIVSEFQQIIEEVNVELASTTAVLNLNYPQ